MRGQENKIGRVDNEGIPKEAQEKGKLQNLLFARHNSKLAHSVPEVRPLVGLLFESQPVAALAVRAKPGGAEGAEPSVPRSWQRESSQLQEHPESEHLIVRVETHLVFDDSCE